MRNIKIINKSFFILVVFAVLSLSACSSTENVETTVVPENNFDVNLEEYSVNSTEFPEVLRVEYSGNNPTLIMSDSDTVAFDGITVGNTLKEVEKIMNAKYDKFYSIHDPENPNIGWYVLNDKYDIVIFDFVADDGSFYNDAESVADNSKVVEIIISNLKYFD